MKFAGGIFPLGEFDDDESDTDEENQEHQQERPTVNMRMHLDDLGSFDDDEEDSLEGSPLTSTRGDKDTSRTPVSQRDLTPREYDGNLEARSPDNNTPRLTEDSVTEEVRGSSDFPLSGASDNGNHTSERKLDTDEAPASNRPLLASNDILAEDLNSSNANTKDKDPVNTLEGERDQDRKSSASPRSKNQSEPENVPDVVVPAVQGSLDSMPSTEGIYSFPKVSQGNVAGPNTYSSQSPTTVAKTQGSVMTTSGSRDRTEGVPESKSTPPDTDSQEESSKRVAMNVAESDGRKGGDGAISETPGPSRYSHNGDSSWRKDEHNSSTIVRPTTLRPKERARAEDANPASCVEDISKDEGYCTSSESQPDAGAGPPAAGETWEKSAVRRDPETMKSPARTGVAEMVDQIPKTSPIFVAEDKAGQYSIVWAYGDFFSHLSSPFDTGLLFYG